MCNNCSYLRNPRRSTKPPDRVMCRPGGPEDPSLSHQAQHSIDTELEKAFGTDRVNVGLGAAATITCRSWDHRGHLIQLASRTIETHSPQSCPAKGQRRP